MSPRSRRALPGLALALVLLAACCAEPTPQAAARYQTCIREGHGRYACEPLLGPTGERRDQAEVTARAHRAPSPGPAR